MLDENSAFVNPPVIEAIAQAIHAEWRQYATPGNPMNVPWEELFPSAQEDNRSAARRIPEVLALAGLKIQADTLPSEQAAADDETIRQHIERHLERLAEAEHDGWMLHRQKNGWSYNPIRDDAKKLHPLMRPYAELPEHEKDKDRSAVKDYQKLIKMAGYKIVYA